MHHLTSCASTQQHALSSVMVLPICCRILSSRSVEQVIVQSTLNSTRWSSYCSLNMFTAFCCSRWVQDWARKFQFYTTDLRAHYLTQRYTWFSSIDSNTFPLLFVFYINLVVRLMNSSVLNNVRSRLSSKLWQWMYYISSFSPPDRKQNKR